MAGSLKADRQNLRTAELEQLFKVCTLSGIVLEARSGAWLWQ